MIRREPKDSDSRAEVATRIGANHFVEAGAGTGKTDTLLKRVVALVTADDGVAMRNIAAITFTERAAEELRGRIRTRLVELGGAQQALLDVDQAAIGTIHSFARRLLADHGLAIGVPPGFEVSSTSAVEQGNAEIWYEVHEAWQDPACRAHVAALAAIGIRESALHPLVFEMLYVRSRIGAAAFASAGQPDLRGAAADLAQFIRTTRDKANAACSNRTDKLFALIWGEWFDHLLTLADGLAAGTADSGAAREVATAPETLRMGNIGSKANWGGQAPGEIRAEIKADLGSACGAVGSAAVDAPVRALLDVAMELFDRFEAQRIRSGELQFDDLLVLCHRLLRDNPGIAAEVSASYRVILVDEFQDTDPLQWEIVRLITAAGQADGMPRPGSLVLVGDPKQSIYGFRGADIATYERVRELFPADSRQGLSVNFRTVHPVVDWVNHLYGPMFEDTSLQVGYEPLVAHHDPAHPDPGPPVLLLQSDDEAAGGGDEADLVVSAIAKILNERWLVTAQDKQTWDRRYERPAAFRDIAVLLPVRTTVGLLLNALDAAGIPYRSNDVSIVFDRPITKGLKSALRAIAREDDQLEVWGALKSPLFGIDDVLLLQHARAGASARWRIPHPGKGSPPEPADAVDEALAILGQAREVADSGRPVEVLQFLIDRCDVTAVIAAQQRAAFEAECLRYLIDQAQAWQDAGGAGLEGFVSWLATAAGDMKSGLGVSDDKLADALQISTVHGAKGLEFPVVILAGMATPPRSGVSALLVRQDGQVEFSVNGNRPPGPLAPGKTPPKPVGWRSWGYRDLEQQRKAEEEAELQRLLYVAMTRAQDHLVVSVVGGARSRAARLRDWLPPADGLAQAVPVSLHHPTPRVLPEAAGPAERIQRAVSVASRPTLLRPSLESDLAARLGIEVQAPRWEVRPPAARPSDEAVPQDPDRKPGGLGGTAMGNAVHEALEAIVLQGPQADIDHIVRESADRNAADRAEAKRRVRAALHSPTVQEAIVSRCFPELTFSYGVPDPASGGVDVIDGVADLIYEVGGRLVVADYKTDAAPSQETKLHYAEQLAVYAKILRDLTGMEVARRVVVWLPPTGPAQDVLV